jgi:hypothetical protein
VSDADRTRPNRIPVSILDLVPVGEGSSGPEAMRHSVELAKLADRSGFTRYWFAEHHGIPDIASAAPENARIEGERDGQIRGLDFPLRRVTCSG